MAEYSVASGARRYLVRVTGEGPALQVSLDGHDLQVRVEPGADESSVRVTAGTSTRVAMIRRSGGEIIVVLGDEQYRLQVEPAVTIVRRTRGGPAGTADLRAPIPGLIVSVEAAVGQLVEQGRPLVVMEAMKMQSELRAPLAGRVEAVHVRPGQEVMGGAVLVSIAPAAAPPERPVTPI